MSGLSYPCSRSWESGIVFLLSPVVRISSGDEPLELLKALPAHDPI